MDGYGRRGKGMRDSVRKPLALGKSLTCCRILPNGLTLDTITAISHTLYCGLHLVAVESNAFRESLSTLLQDTRGARTRLKLGRPVSEDLKRFPYAGPVDIPTPLTSQLFRNMCRRMWDPWSSNVRMTLIMSLGSVRQPHPLLGRADARIHER